MKFFKLPHLASVVWNKEKNRSLAIFVDGEFETEDKKAIKILADKGYPYEGDPPKGIKLNSQKTFKKVSKAEGELIQDTGSFDTNDVSPGG